MLKRFIAEVVERKDLSEEEASKAMGHIMEGEALPTQIASFLTALRMKGETSQEIAGFARAMRSKAVRIRAKRRGMRGGHLRDGRRRVRDFQHFHGRGFRCRWRRVDRGQARQPLSLQPERERRCFGSSRG